MWTAIIDGVYLIVHGEERHDVLLRPHGQTARGLHISQTGDARPMLAHKRRERLIL
jgi:hypothetical protein